MRLSCITDAIFIDVLLTAEQTEWQGRRVPLLRATPVRTRGETVPVTQHANNECGCGTRKTLEGVICVATSNSETESEGESRIYL